jgi:ankyrin repeat protein
MFAAVPRGDIDGAVQRLLEWFLRADQRLIMCCAVLCRVQALLGEGAEGAAEDDEEQEEEEEEINLHAAASDGNAEQLQQLLEAADCDVNQADEEGRTALHFAGGT